MYTVTHLRPATQKWGVSVWHPFSHARLPVTERGEVGVHAAQRRGRRGAHSRGARRHRCPGRSRHEGRSGPRLAPERGPSPGRHGEVGVGVLDLS
jgi:hypothetical protein